MSVKHIEPSQKFTYGGAVIGVFYANKGEGLPMHSHFYSHSVSCMNGSCKITQGDKTVVMTKDSTPINLLAGFNHEIEALENGTIFMNVFSEQHQ